MHLNMGLNGLDELRVRLGEMIVGGKWAKVESGIVNDVGTTIVRGLKEQSTEVQLEASPPQSLGYAEETPTTSYLPKHLDRIP